MSKIIYLPLEHIESRYTAHMDRDITKYLDFICGCCNRCSTDEWQSQAIFTIINNWEKASSNCYNIVGFNTTKIELANRIKSFTGCEVTENKTLIDNRDYAVSSELIKKDFGFLPNHDVDFTINEVLSAIKLGIVSPRPEHRNS